MPDENIPQDLPVEGKSLLENIEKAQSKPAPRSIGVPPLAEKETEDIFADIKEPPVLPGAKSSSSPASEQPILGGAPKNEGTLVETPHQGFKKVLITIVSIVLFAGLLAGGAYWAYMYLLKPKTLNPNLNLNVNVNTNAALTNESESTSPATSTETAETDSDNDGLTDEKEFELDTDSRNPDSDGDRLFDGEEVNTYKTDPLKKDTDGDGFEDGAEVQNGYDPAGPGKLIRIPAGQ